MIYLRGVRKLSDSRKSNCVFVFRLGIGDTIETFLYNQNGEEEASYLQSIELRKGNM